ncbi:hypothetical protein AAG906_014891 [Vitis piasezkii]
MKKDCSKFHKWHEKKGYAKPKKAWQVFKVEVKKQCGKQIKIMRKDKGIEYYGRYTEDGQLPSPFVNFLQEHGIVAQYNMLGSPN